MSKIRGINRENLKTRRRFFFLVAKESGLLLSILLEVEIQGTQEEPQG